MRVRAVVLLALASAVLTPGAAAAETTTISQHLLAADGSPSLVANRSPVGGAPARWRVCDPECGPIVAEGPTFSPGPTAAGTTFEATTTGTDGAVSSVRSRPWGGQVAVVGPPTVTGEVRIGRVVTAAGGTWTGGWGDDRGVPALRACRTPAATDCRFFGPRDVLGSARQGASAIDPAFAGWYVGAYEQRHARETAFPAVAPAPEPPLGTPTDRRPVDPGVATPTLAYGPLVGPVPPARTGEPPRVAGRLAVGRRVTPRPGTWPDAPDDGRIASVLRACPTREDTASCVLLHDLGGTGGRPGPGAPVTLGRRLLGWYVGAVDRHRGAGGDAGAFTPARPTTAVPAPDLATVHGPLSTTPVGLGFTPRVAVRRRIAAGRRLRLATVRCAGACVARVTLRAGGRTVVRRIAVRAGRSTPVVAPRSRFRGARSIRVTIRVDHARPVVRGTVRIG
ncbi:unannotated protein [freshwater metagenome]|uniref:Unannotated protein n=1 Tax=freshwater metagenome TaxID=449393 RepID=A0A6J7HNU0_9ZZZZ|nr:hypothetical protein [Actinomycetota bacterium]